MQHEHGERTVGLERADEPGEEQQPVAVLGDVQHAAKRGAWIRLAGLGLRQLFAMDMYRPFWNAIKADEKLAHVAIVHDPFHVMKRAGEAVSQVRKDAFFRAGPEQPRIG